MKKEQLGGTNMEIPLINVDVCSDEEDGEVNEFNNNFTPLKFRSDVNREINTPSPSWGVDSLSGRRRNNDNSGFQNSTGKFSDKYRFKIPHNNDGADFIVKPTRKNGLGLPCDLNRFNLESIHHTSPELSRRQFRSGSPISVQYTDSSFRLSPGTTRRLPPSHLSGLSSDSVNRLSPEILTRQSPIHEDNGLDGTDNELQKLKETTARLKLATRRPSYVAWHAMYIDRPQLSRRPYTIHETEEAGSLTEARKEKINNSLEWIKTELMEMRSQDKELARQLLSLRQDINKFKLQKSCREHEDLLEDAQDELEELQELSEMCDLPLEEFGFSRTPGPLKHIGVTRLNLSARRFSTC